MFSKILLILALACAVASAQYPSGTPSWLVQGNCPPSTSTKCNSLQSKFQTYEPIIVTETLQWPYSIVQADVATIQGTTGSTILHPTGIEFESVANPAQDGLNAPPSSPPFEGAYIQDLGLCNSLASLVPNNFSADVDGEDLCSLNFVFALPGVVNECSPPGSLCQRFAKQQVYGQIAIQGIFAAFYANGNIYYEAPIVGGSGIFRGFSGYVVITQTPTYESFSYAFYRIE